MRKATDRRPPAPPGSRDNPAPVDITGGAFFHCSHALYADLRERGAVAWARFHAPGREGDGGPGFDETLWVVTTCDDAARVLQDDARFRIDPQRPPSDDDGDDPDDELFYRSLLALDPPDHTRLRKLVQPWFAGPALQRLAPRIRRIADDLLDLAEAAAAARGERAPDRRMELVEAYAYPLPVTVISEMLGLPASDRDQVRAWTEELLQRRSPRPTPRQRAEQRRFVAYLRDQVATKRREPSDDLIGFLVDAEDHGDRLDEDELLAMVFLLYVAGHVTTVNLVANAVGALLRWPDQLARVRADRTLVRNVVEETLRFWGPVEHAVPRVAREPLVVDGVRIAAGERVSACLAAAGRDPAQFDDPDRFDVTRPDARRHIAFGRGIHTCLGAPLARLEGQIALEALLDRCPALRPAVPPDALPWKDMFLRGFREVPVLF